VDGKPISEKDWAKLVEAIKPHVEAENAIGDLGQLTTFEIFTAMAFLHFRQVKADWQVMEVGLGGRLDATNIVQPEICVLTSISYEHMDVLGHTLTEIAREKSGIIKPGAEVVSAPQFPEALKEIERLCGEKGVRLIKVGRDVTWQKGEFNEGGQNFRVRGMRGAYDIRIPLLGEHQMENASDAIAAIELLIGKGVKITPENIKEGLAKVDWPGRLQILGRNPWIIADGAQNAYSMQRLGEALKTYFKYGKARLILGFGADKDIDGMAAEAVKITGDIILVASRHPRAVRAGDLITRFQKYGVTPKTAESVRDAVKLALKDAAPDDLICAAGSLFIVAEVMEMVGG
jgi:dihydrofolate synthase/folylpolyglutamate synthase